MAPEKDTAAPSQGGSSSPSNLILMHLLNILDRNNLSQARLDTLEKDLGVQGTDYNLATSILFVGYLLTQLPSNLLLTRVRPSVIPGVCKGHLGCELCPSSGYSIICWLRFFLGFVEEPLFPGAVMLI
ncbi:hypothetical protein BDV23DRAFT_178995 [Aspergillus alliaceus]|uniref:Uncharacterized protein n=1 Tax=Petromyces alliaceus TaxID=209559 RepID=A0A5N7CMH1_PETAA|nr:uncharacterized protein BDW43DRAFT_314529 [Aspergillus alliaceus]KAB8229881.1 hypothetical protein BDW43DRAFT_314529 [Aspergillus alliaceus]KAE8395007.1 hypothetical protein BDV23DRAFT_178995 [Aspergillus alliaceus]